MAKQWLQLSVLLVGIVVVCLLAHQSLAAPQPTEAVENKTNLLDTLQELVGRLRTQRQDYYRQKAEDDAEIQRTRENARLLQTQLDDVHRQEADLDEQIRRYESELRTLDDQSALKTDVRRAVARETAAFIARQKSEIESGIPYKQNERIARLGAGPADANEATSPSAAIQLGRLWSYAQEELRLAGSSETYSDRASLEDDVTPYARYFRIGQLMLGYVTEDGVQTALWLPTLDGGQWRSIPDPGQAAQVRNAVEILDRRQAPGFVSLPIVTDPLPAKRKAP